jgi:hypothetical protein
LGFQFGTDFFAQLFLFLLTFVFELVGNFGLFFMLERDFFLPFNAFALDGQLIFFC